MMGSDVFVEPLLSKAISLLLLDDAVCAVDAFSFPFVLLLLDPVTDVGVTVTCGGGDGGRAYRSVQRLAVRSCCARLRMYSVAIEGTDHRTH